MKSTIINGAEINESDIRLKAFERSTRLAEIKAVYRSKVAASERTHIQGTKDAVAYLRAIWNKDRLELAEEFLMICLNGAHQTLGWVKVASGGFNATLVDPRVIFSIALQTASSAIIVSHNHPSGGLLASTDDIEMTRRICQAGKLLKIKVLDHIILTRESHYSFADDGKL